MTVFDDEVPAVANLDADLLAALREAATDAADDGVTFVVNSGWRSAEYQEQLLRDAVAEYGSAQEAARWVATADTSPHVQGSAVDVGPWAATAWLSEHGTEYGLCQVYANEPWHYELRPDAVDGGCPASTPTRRTTRGCSSDQQSSPGRPCRPDARDPAGEDRGLVVLFAVYLVLLAWVVLWKLEVPWVGEAGGAWSSSSRSSPRRCRCQHALRRRRQPRALRPLRPLPRPPRAVVAVVEGRRRGRRGEPGPRGRPVRPGRRELRPHRRRRQHRRRPGRARPARAGAPQAPARTATVLTRVCAVGTVLAVLAGALFVASPLRYGPPQDARCTRAAPWRT